MAGVDRVGCVVNFNPFFEIEVLPCNVDHFVLVLFYIKDQTMTYYHEYCRLFRGILQKVWSAAQGVRVERGLQLPVRGALRSMVGVGSCMNPTPPNTKFEIYSGWVKNRQRG